MQLSPLNFYTMSARQINTQNEWRKTEKKDSRRIEEVVMYKCPECGELHDWEDDARDCCGSVDENHQPGSEPHCPVCGEKYESHRDAADCCLWKDLDAPSRWKIADAVEAGSDWMTELRINPTTGAMQ